MLSNKVAVAGIGLMAFAAAAGAGVYVASRQADPLSLAPTSETAPADATPAVGVEATEGVIDDKETPPAAAPAAPAPTVAAPPAAAPPAATSSPKPARRPVVEGPRRSASTSTPAPARPERSRPAPAVREEPASAEPAERASSRPSVPTSPEPSLEQPTAREERRPIEPVPSLPPARQFEQVTVPAEAVIGLQLESGLSSDTARVEDRIEARVTRDVRANGMVAIPAGSRVLGSVSVVERGGKMKERARLGVRFHTVILADGTELPLQTETVFREGDSPANASAAKMGGGAIGGAILGAILGGGKGAAIGAGVGAGAGTAAVMAGGRKPAQIQAGSPMTVKVLSPVSVTVEK
jgi:type IV secretory pathway VirB10-like protein